jgi:nicotinamide mononucleotide transporter
MDLLFFLEFSSVVFGLIFIYLLIRENKWCWLFGGLGSLLSIILFYLTNLYSEAILYIYYVLIAAYGWYIWNNQGEKENFRIAQWSLWRNLVIAAVGLLLGGILGWFFNRFTDADQPYIDAQTTIFSFIASYMEVHKVLSAWIFWIVVNAVTIGLYSYKELYMYAGLMVIYFALSVFGYIDWRNKYRMESK